MSGEVVLIAVLLAIALIAFFPSGPLIRIARALGAAGYDQPFRRFRLARPRLSDFVLAAIFAAAILFFIVYANR